LGGLLSVVNLGGKEVNRDLQLIAEIAHLLRFSFKVLLLRMGEHEIEDRNVPLDVAEFVFLAVQPAREDASGA
jgi:hypothetical protein